MIITVKLSAFFFTVLLLGYAGALVAVKCGVVDIPTERSSHHEPIPKGGGVGLLVAFLVTACFFDISPFVMLPAILVSLQGYICDRRECTPLVRLVIQFLAAGVVSSCMGWTWGIALMASVFVVGTANFYNFMDGIDGLAALTGIVGFSLLGCYGAFVVKLYAYSLLCFAIAVACLGFLPMNFPRARVFMGDVGSILLGFVYAVVVIQFSHNLAEFLLLVSFLFLFYADVLVCLLERLGQGEALTKPHRSHLYQFLANELGIAHWKVTVGYMLVQICVALCAWWAALHGMRLLFGWLIFCTVIFILINHLVKYYLQVR